MKRGLIILITCLFALAGLVSERPALASHVERAQSPETRLPASTSSSYTAIDAGQEHTCALTTGGGARCWGLNWGRLGNGLVESSNKPVDVSGLSSGVRAISAGSYHACAVTASGGAKCWGDNYWGQLGDGTTDWSKTPVDVSGLASGVSDITAGESHTCALTASGGVKCWGDNDYGQLGNGTTAGSSTPVDVTGLTSGVSAVEANIGLGYTCALTVVGGVKCWGYHVGQNSLTSVDVSGLTSGVSAISTGVSHACAIISGGARCWGSNGDGQLGDGTTESSNVPVEVSGLSSGVSAIAAGRSHSCAVTASGGLKCWGLNNRGQLGNGTAAGSLTPVGVIGLTSGAIDVTAGVNHTCALTVSGPRCWGENHDGQLGNGSLPYSRTPVNFSGWTGGVLAIAGGDTHTCAATMSGEARCWGENNFGQLGDETMVNSITPVGVSGLTSGVSAFAANGGTTCAIRSGEVFCWGFSEASSAPVWLNWLGSGVSAIAAGSNHYCALTAGGGVKCWADEYYVYNNYGQVGNLSGLTSGASAIATGNFHSCAVTANGGAVCWGWNMAGQLGNGTTEDSETPVNVSGLSSGVISIAAGYTHTCALTTGGGVKCWGSGGVLGNGAAAGSLTPVAVIGLESGVSAIAAGGFHTCALTAGGGVKCWGANTYGELGNGIWSSGGIPVDVIGLTSGASAITAGFYHTCALTFGGAKCWGKNEFGELGNGQAAYSPTPVDVYASLQIYLPMAMR